MWSLWGYPQAINAGDSMFALSRIAILRLSESGVDSEKVIESARILDVATLDMIEGQCLDLCFEDELEVSLDAYLDMINKKTAALFACSLQLGSLVGSNDLKLSEGFAHFGRQLGILFQVRDDMLGVWGLEKETGKPLAADIRRRKKSLPIVYALSSVSGDTKSRLLEVYKNESLLESDVSDVLAILDSIRAKDYCYEVAVARRDEALKTLDALNVSGSIGEELRDIANFSLDRTF